MMIFHPNQTFNPSMILSTYNAPLDRLLFFGSKCSPNRDDRSALEFPARPDSQGVEGKSQ